MTENKDNGGPAFPVEVDSTQPNERQTWWPKLTKRMLYAAQEEFNILPPRMRRLWARMGELRPTDAQARADAKDAERYRCVALVKEQGSPTAGFAKVEREPDWSNSRTSPMEIWKNRLNTLADRLEMADGAIAFRDEVIANLRTQLAEAKTNQKPKAAQPCRSPCCECELGKCCHPGFYDARHMPCEGST